MNLIINYHPYNTAIEQTKTYFEKGNYTKAYSQVSGLDIKEKDQEIYDQIVMVNRFERFYVSYYNYKELDLKKKALKSLIEGVTIYDEYKDEANELGVITLVDGVKQSLLDILMQQYGIDETKAKEIAAIQDSDELKYEMTIEAYAK